MKFVKKLFQWITAQKISHVIVPRAEHPLSRKGISPNAIKVLYRLHQAGYDAYLVGGGVRDLLLGGHPKDFDVTTNAHPEQVRELFRNCHLIGRRFRLAHVFFGPEIVEVATFRAQDRHENYRSEQGMIVRDNVYGTSIQEDAMRRDFTINALYYNIADFSIVDYFGGLQDIQNRQIRMIGDPSERFREDPVRMLRAIRFAGKLDFKIDKDIRHAIFVLENLLSHIASARLFDEYCKLFLHGAAFRTFHLLKEFRLLTRLFPGIKESDLIDLALHNSDTRVRSGKSLSPGFLIVVFLWNSLQERVQATKHSQKMPRGLVWETAMDDVLAKQRKVISIPRQFTQMIKEVWHLQWSLVQRQGRRVNAVFSHPKFRAAYDFLMLRAEAGDLQAKKSAQWWTEYLASEDEHRDTMMNQLDQKHNRHRGGKTKRRDK